MISLVIFFHKCDLLMIHSVTHLLAHSSGQKICRICFHTPMSISPQKNIHLAVVHAWAPQAYVCLWRHIFLKLTSQLRFHSRTISSDGSSCNGPYLVIHVLSFPAACMDSMCMDSTNTDLLLSQVDPRCPRPYAHYGTV